MDGFTITGGNADNAVSININGYIAYGNYGGGMFNLNASSPGINNVIFSENTGNYGGGIYNWSSSPTLSNTTIISNTANSNGGGMFNNDASPVITNSTISGNIAGNGDNGGGIYNDASAPAITNVLISGTKDGAALYEIVAGGPAVLAGSMVPSVTGMARANDESDSFITSENGASVLTRIAATDGSSITTYPIKLGGVSFTLTDGDMAAGCADDETTPLPPTNPFIAVDAHSVLITYPNPTKGPSKVVFTTGVTTRTLVEVFDLNGRNIATLFNQEAQKGEEYTLDFNGNMLPNGVYIYRMTTDNETIIEKFMIAR